MIGEIVAATSIRVPSLWSRTVSKCCTCSRRWIRMFSSSSSWT
jgi:hypothetical protein